MSKTLNDGWYTICGHEVWVENGNILRGLGKDINGSPKTTWPYRKGGGGWEGCSSISVSAFIAGFKRGTVSMQ